MIGVVGLLTGVGVFLARLHWPRSRAMLERTLAPMLRLVGRVRRRPIDDPRGVAAATFDRVRSLRLRPPVVAAASTYALANWLTDVLCLACAILAVGPHLPWDRLLLVWAAGAGASGLTPTPGGLGVVDVVLIAALVGTGVGFAHCHSGRRHLPHHHVQAAGHTGLGRVRLPPAATDGRPSLDRDRELKRCASRSAITGRHSKGRGGAGVSR